MRITASLSLFVSLALVACDGAPATTGDAAVPDSTVTLPDGRVVYPDPDSSVPPSDATIPPPRRCPDTGVWPDGTPCDPIGSDWWPDPEGDQAGPHHTPSGSAITDLRAEHITPFGGWFTFTSPLTPYYSEDLVTCWSTNESDLDTAAGMSAAAGDRRCKVEDTFAAEGQPSWPIILTNLEPDTTYYLRVRIDHNEEHPSFSNVVSFRTSPDPRRAVTGAHPRVFATADQLAALRARYEAGDERVRYWVGLMEPRTRRAIDPSDNGIDRTPYSVNAALLWHITGETRWRDGAIYLLEDVLLEEYESGRVVSNAYRWAGSRLATVTDLMWNELDAAFRQRVIDAMEEEDQLEQNTDPRLDDTDELAAFTMIQIAHGLTFLGSDDLSASSMEWMQDVFERALRTWYGIMQVKMRRAHGMWGLAGGAMDDGVDYARGTQGYWLEAFLYLENMGFTQAAYAEWVWNHFRTHGLYGTVPDGNGYVTWGDMEDIEDNQTQRIDTEFWGNDAIHICLLSRYGRPEQAGYVRAVLLAERDPEDRFGQHHNYALLCDDPSITARDVSDLPLAFRSDGVGLVFARSSWEPDASYLFFTAGWRGVDHMHDDVGHFSLWSGGDWIVHEEPSYDFQNAEKHNVLFLGRDTQTLVSEDRSIESSPSISRIVRTEVDDTHVFILADITSAYSRDYGSGDRTTYAEITRSLYWDKATDRVVVYDRVRGRVPDSREQHLVPPSGGRAAPTVTRLYDEQNGDLIELLMVVNGTGTLAVSDSDIGVAGLAAFDRSTGDLR